MTILGKWLTDADRNTIAVADDVSRLTYGELLSLSQDTASELQANFGRGRYLLIPAHKSVAFVTTLVSVARSGNIPVPFDPAAPQRVIDEIIVRCGRAEVIGPDNLTSSSRRAARLHDSEVETELVLFTSGTTGYPKGVPVSSCNLQHSVATVSSYLEYAQFRHAAIVLPLHYSYALLTQLYAMLYVGGSCRIFSSFRNPIKIAKSVEAEALSTFCGVPSTYHAITAVNRMSPLRMPSIRVLCSAGAAMDRSLMPEIREIFPSARFFDNYGMTEATPRISYIRDDDPRFRQPTCGRAISGLEIRILDEKTFETKADGEAGVVAVRGPNVFKCYLNDPASTESAFTKDGFLLSGDIGYLDQGYLYISGRADDIFNVGGEKVAPLEIERALGEHAAIIASAIGRQDDPVRGTMAIAYVELRDKISRTDLVDFLGKRLPPAKIPQRFVEVHAWPLTANGKLQRSRLAPEDPAFVIGDLR